MRRVVLIAVLLAGASARADDRYTLREGDTLEAVAAHYYGARWKAVYLAAANGLSARDAKPGQALTLPSCRLYRVRRGDTLALIARRHLGDARRYTTLLAANGLAEQSALEVGQELLIPFQLRHTLQAGESLESVARRYYRDTSRAALLREHNALPQAAVAPGAVLLVPVFDRDSLLVDQKPPPTAPATRDAAAVGPPAPDSPAPRAPTTGELATATAVPSSTVGAPAEPAPELGPSPELQRLIERYRRGAFEEACGGLERLLATLALSRSDRGELVRYLGYCAVASGDRAAARQYFRQWIEMEPNARLDPIRTSPKILAIFQAALDEARPGQRDGLPRPPAP